MEFRDSLSSTASRLQFSRRRSAGVAARSNKVSMTRPLGLGEEAMKVRTGVKGGRIAFNRCEAAARAR
jgi:hypothetical protein